MCQVGRLYKANFWVLIIKREKIIKKQNMEDSVNNSIPATGEKSNIDAPGEDPKEDVGSNQDSIENTTHQVQV